MAYQRGEKMKPELGTKVYCIYDDQMILVEKVGYLGKDSFIIADFSDCTEIDSLKWDYDCYNEMWFTDLEKAKAKLTEIAIEDGWTDFEIIQVDDGCYMLEDDCE